MPRSYPSPYLGNINTREVHKLSNEKAGCQIATILAHGHDVPFYSLDAAKRQDYDPCAHCLPGSKR